jgi:flagellar hook-length control protein FliK
LGSVRLELAVRQGTLSATMETETIAARAALLDNLPLLRERLVEHGIRVEQFDVHVRDDRGGEAQQQATENRDQQPASSPDDRHSPAGLQEAETEPDGLPPGPSRFRGDETLNVTV